MEADLPKLKRSEILDVLDDKLVKVKVELPAKLHRDLVAYLQVLSEGKGSPISDPVQLSVPMLERFRNEADSMLVNWLPWSECTNTRSFGLRRQTTASKA